MATYISVMSFPGSNRQSDGAYTCGAYDIPSMHMVYFVTSLMLRVPTGGVTVAGILNGFATASDTDCQIIPATDDLIFEVPVVGGTAASLIVGKRYGIKGSVAGAAGANTGIDQSDTSNDALIFHRFGQKSLSTGLYVTAFVSIYHGANQWNGVVEGA